MKDRFSVNLKNITNWTPPTGWIKINTIDAHCAGEPLRIIIDGLPIIQGNTILEKRKFMLENFDELRKALMLEPRGHADMYGCVITPPVSEDSDFGVIFTHNEGYSTMCGHGIIAVTQVALQTGMIAKIKPFGNIFTNYFKRLLFVIDSLECQLFGYVLGAIIMRLVSNAYPFVFSLISSSDSRAFASATTSPFWV